MSGADTYPTPAHGWTCFHCGENFPGTFVGHRDAQRHFGGSIHARAACLTKQEKGILIALRDAEALLVRYREEDTDLHRAIARLQSEHSTALIREEEKGYNRGLRDADGDRQHG